MGPPRHLKESCIVFSGMSTEILVVGGGYAGCLAAARLARNARKYGLITRITLVNARPSFVERVRLHQKVAGDTLRSVDLLAALAGTAVRVVVGTVAAVDLGARRAQIESGGVARWQSFDELVVATGSVEDGGALAGPHTWSCATDERATELRDRLRASPTDVVVVGGGHTGVELATELGSRAVARSVTLVAGREVAPALSAAGRAYVRSTLRDFGVALVEGDPVGHVDATAVTLASGKTIVSGATVLTTGFRPTTFAGDAGLGVDEVGRALVDARLRSVTHSFVHVVGDAARAPRPLRMACATAQPMAAFAADDVARELAGLEPQAFSFGYFLQCVSLGRKRGIAQKVDGWDRPRAVWLRARPGAWLKEAICRYAAGSMRMEANGIAYMWPREPAARAVAALGEGAG